MTLHIEDLDLPPVMPLFDRETLQDSGNAFVNHHIAKISLGSVADAPVVYELAVDWLLEQLHSENNFKTYRSELGTFLHWCFDVEEVSVSQVNRQRLLRYLDYCCQPPEPLITHRNVAQFVQKKSDSERRPNPLWRPFLCKRQDMGTYKLSLSAQKTKLALLSSFFNFLIYEGYTERNPAMMLMKNGRFSGKPQASPLSEDLEDLRCFTELQWSYIVASANFLAKYEPETHERTRFLLMLLYACYLRISEVAARPGYSPVMSQFRRDSKTGVWGFLVPQSKGGKTRTVAVSKELLSALKRYRKSLGLTELPAPREMHPLFIRHRPGAHGRDAGLLNANLGIRQIREQVGYVFEQAANQLDADGLTEDAAEVRSLTVHSIRHTGISHDINLNGRPLSHVQADAGHDSIDTTSRYLHTSRVERHQTASGKPLDRLSGIE